jgi:hypothetical protein
MRKPKRENLGREVRLVPCIAALAALLVSAPSVHAHAGAEGVAVIDRTTPAVKRFVVRVVPGAVGKLELGTSGSTTAELIGVGGQPVLRVGKRGVEANAAAPEWYQFNEPLGIARVPPTATPATAPKWVRISTQRKWQWFDHRLHPAGHATVDRWTIPFRVDGRQVTVQGRVIQSAPQLGLRLGSIDQLPGLDIAVIESPTLSLRIATSGKSIVDVYGASGELFASIGPDGVTANARSPVWAVTAQYRNRDLLGAVVDPRAKPKRVEVSPAPQLAWADPRLVPTGRVDGPAGSVLARWSVPIRIRGTGTRTVISGTTVVASAGPKRQELPPEPGGQDDSGGGSTGLILAAVALSLLGVGGLVFVSRRNRTS